MVLSEALYRLYTVLNSKQQLLLWNRLKVRDLHIHIYIYIYYPVSEFTYKNKLRKITDKSSDVDKDTTNVLLNIYYSEKYGISRGFSAVHIVFSIIALAFIFFGFVALFKSK